MRRWRLIGGIAAALTLGTSVPSAASVCLSPDFILEFKDAVVVEGRVSSVELRADGVTEALGAGGLRPYRIRIYQANVLITDLLRGRPAAHSFTYEWTEWLDSTPAADDSCAPRPVAKGETWVFTLWDSYSDAARRQVTRHSRAAYDRVKERGELRQRLDNPYPIKDRPETRND